MQSYDIIMIKGMRCNVLLIPKNQVSHIPNKTNIVNYHSIQDIMSLNKTLYSIIFEVASFEYS